MVTDCITAIHSDEWGRILMKPFCTKVQRKKLFHYVSIGLWFKQTDQNTNKHHLTLGHIARCSVVKYTSSYDISWAFSPFIGTRLQSYHTSLCITALLTTTFPGFAVVICRCNTSLLRYIVIVVTSSWYVSVCADLVSCVRQIVLCVCVYCLDASKRHEKPRRENITVKSQGRLMFISTLEALR